MLSDLKSLSLEVLLDGTLPSTGEAINCCDLAALSAEFSRSRISSMEMLLRSKPENYSLHFMLFAFYLHAVEGKGGSPTAEDEAAFRRERSWLTEHRPDCHLLFGKHCLFPESDQQDEQHWLRHIEAAVPVQAVLESAFAFFYGRDPEVAEKVALKGQMLAPDRIWWAVNLCRTYIWQASNCDEESGQEPARNAVEQFKILRRLKETQERNGIAVVFNLGRAAVKAGDIELARECALELMDSKKRAMQANVLLGLIGILQEDVPAALQFLGNAARVFKRGHGSPTFALAAELYQFDQTDEVLSFLRECASKCARHYCDGIAGLIQAIESGAEPDWPYEWPVRG